MAERDVCLYKIKLAKCAQRYNDMIAEFKKLVQFNTELSADEQRLLTAAYKNEVDLRRTSWRNLVSLEETKETRNNKYKLELVKMYRISIENELCDICSDIIEYLDKNIIPCDGSTESKIFCYQLRADYCRYMAEIEVDTENQVATGKALSAYKGAYDIATNELVSTDPLRLGVGLNYSVFFFEVIKSSEEACAIAKETFNAAIVDMHKLSRENYQDATLLLQTIWNNLQFWTSCANYTMYPTNISYTNYSQYPNYPITTTPNYQSYAKNQTRPYRPSRNSEYYGSHSGSANRNHARRPRAMVQPKVYVKKNYAQKAGAQSKYEFSDEEDNLAVDVTDNDVSQEDIVTEDFIDETIVEHDNENIEDLDDADITVEAGENDAADNVIEDTLVDESGADEAINVDINAVITIEEITNDVATQVAHNDIELAKAAESIAAQDNCESAATAVTENKANTNTNNEVIVINDSNDDLPVLENLTNAKVDNKSAEEDKKSEDEKNKKSTIC